MNAIFLTLFVSLVLVGGAMLLFAFLFAQRTHDHADRMSLLPLQDDPTGHTHGSRSKDASL